ncbi:unnamed protein product [Urochloa decumbens]|uniref:F-box domain-containing protein n=1 Tax=Urochloa decumbens TaxID=240449 RepID=A0ABC8VK47_9POAL
MAPKKRSRLSIPPASPAGGGANDGVLPTDVLHDILLRLPAKQLCRLRVVCRAWRALTSDPCFARAHTPRHPLFAGLILASERKELQVLDLSGDVVKRLRITDERDEGDMLLRGIPPGVCIAWCCRKACVLNPATGDVTVLDTNRLSKVNGVFTKFVVGRIPATGEHKVLHIYQDTRNRSNDERQKCNVTTLDSRDHKWRSRPGPPTRIVWDSPPVIGGVAYFFVNSCFTEDNGTQGIASFDLETEDWRPVILRRSIGSLSAIFDGKGFYWNSLHFAELNGSLVIVHLNSKNSSMDLWFLEDMDKNLWTKRYSMRRSTACGWSRYNSYPPLDILDGRIILWERSEQALRAFHPKTSTWTELAVLKDYSDVGMLEGSLLCSGL